MLQDIWLRVSHRIKQCCNRVVRTPFTARALGIVIICTASSALRVTLCRPSASHSVLTFMGILRKMPDTTYIVAG